MWSSFKVGKLMRFFFSWNVFFFFVAPPFSVKYPWGVCLHSYEAIYLATSGACLVSGFWKCLKTNQAPKCIYIKSHLLFFVLQHIRKLLENLSKKKKHFYFEKVSGSIEAGDVLCHGNVSFGYYLTTFNWSSDSLTTQFYEKPNITHPKNAAYITNDPRGKKQQKKGVAPKNTQTWLWKFSWCESN